MVVVLAIAVLALVAAGGGFLLLHRSSDRTGAAATTAPIRRHPQVATATASPQQPSPASNPSATTADSGLPATTDQAARSQNTGVGFGPVKLGMNERQLELTGAVTSAPWGHLAGGPDGSNTCWALPLKGQPGANVMFNPNDGLVDAIVFGPTMATSRGIRLGASWEDLSAAYPELDGSSADGIALAPVTATVRYYFDASPGQAVRTIALGLNNQGCFD